MTLSALRLAAALLLLPLGGLSIAGAQATGAPAGGFVLTEGADHPLAGRVWSVARSAFVPPAEVETAVARARFVLLGEIHDNPDHHALQAQLLAAAGEGGRRPAVVLEMLPRDRQGDVEAYLASGKGTAEGFGEALGWAESGWPDYAIYRPVIEVAVAQGLPVVAGDTPREERRKVAAEGAEALGAERIAALRLAEPLGEAADAVLLDTLFDGHCAMMPREALTPLVAVQRLRDATLADAMISGGISGGGEGAVLIAGSGHVRKDLGVPRYLAWREPDADVVAVGFVEVREGESDPALYAGGTADVPPPYDYLWFTPRKDRGDPCEGLKERFGGRK
ncbi:ChaN family lipoprotein [Stappia sp. WLB 29]|uniref:ChaN family lipoprotein n=1 Tax=Stappia sp. WLB 29 TaxID=2925220 RepID=UPI0020C08D12|nr:ChaN family lipoprotein [Stappia sp. WLB 29]